jgi:5-methyltetrahydrofolate--homocysteine methyltransferase
VNCTEVLVRSRPEVIQEIHESFLEAGADAVETDTFGANKLVVRRVRPRRADASS